MLYVFGFIIGVIVIIAQCFFEGWVIQHIWNWYLSYNYGLLSYHTALGIGIIATLLTSKAPITQHLTKKQKAEWLIASFLSGFIVPLLVLSIAFLLK